MDDRRTDSLESQLADAYDRMGPSAEAERRMLSALVAAQQHAPKRRVKALHLVVPLAACLVLLAGVGVLALNGALSASLDETLGAASGTAADPSSVSELSAIGDALESDFDLRFPFVTLSSGERLRVALGDEAPLTADPAHVGDELERTVATGPDEASSAPCTVFATSDPDHPFAIRYDDDTTFYLADRVEA